MKPRTSVEYCCRLVGISDSYKRCSGF